MKPTKAPCLWPGCRRSHVLNSPLCHSCRHSLDRILSAYLIHNGTDKAVNYPAHDQAIEEVLGA